MASAELDERCGWCRRGLGVAAHLRGRVGGSRQAQEDGASVAPTRLERQSVRVLALVVLPRDADLVVLSIDVGVGQALDGHHGRRAARVTDRARVAVAGRSGEVAPATAALEGGGREVLGIGVRRRGPWQHERREHPARHHHRRGTMLRERHGSIRSAVSAHW